MTEKKTPLDMGRSAKSLKIKSFTAIEFFNKIDETKSVKTIKVKQIKEHVYSAIIDE